MSLGFIDGAALSNVGRGLTNVNWIRLVLASGRLLLLKPIHLSNSKFKSFHHETHNIAEGLLMLLTLMYYIDVAQFYEGICTYKADKKCLVIIVA